MANAHKTQNCTVCGSRLEYLTSSETLVCTYCEKTVASHIKCPNGHFICEQCHSGDSMKMIEEILFSTKEKDPARIAELMMNHPALPMLGCEHAFIAGGALAASLRNSRYGKFTDDDVREVLKRTSRQAIGGYCGLTGVCGIVPAIGACFSVFLAARCGSDTEQKMVMETVIKVAGNLAALTGPSCCKAYVRTALDRAVTEFSERFGLVLPASTTPAVCKHSSKHPHDCREERCPYYHKESKDIFADSIHLPVTSCHS